MISHRGFKGACKTLCWVLVYYAISFFLLFSLFLFPFFLTYGPIPIKHFILYEHLQIGERESMARLVSRSQYFNQEKQTLLDQSSICFFCPLYIEQRIEVSRESQLRMTGFWLGNCHCFCEGKKAKGKKIYKGMGYMISIWKTGYHMWENLPQHAHHRLSMLRYWENVFFCFLFPSILITKLLSIETTRHSSYIHMLLIISVTWNDIPR